MSMHKLIWFSTMFVHSYMEKTIYNTRSLHHWSFALDSAVIRFFLGIIYNYKFDVSSTIALYLFDALFQ